MIKLGYVVTQDFFRIRLESEKSMFFLDLKSLFFSYQIILIVSLCILKEESMGKV